MGILIHQDNDNPHVVYQTFHEKWDLEAFICSIDELEAMIDSMPLPVTIVIDLQSNTTYFPNIIACMAHIRTKDLSRVHQLIVVGGDYLIIRMVNFARTLLPPLKNRFRFVNSYNDIQPFIPPLTDTRPSASPAEYHRDSKLRHSA